MYYSKGVEKIQARLKRNKKHVMVIFICMNMENYDFIQRMKMRAQKKR